tara:strand:+ start:127 stop:513 length:387 start_codon:yes stop_codon:yes gene_type:complete
LIYKYLKSKKQLFDMLEVKGYENLNKILWDNKDNGSVLMLYFGASWCGPCQKLKDKIKEEESNLSKLVCIHLDCDDEENEDILEDWKVESLPTQIFVHINENNVVKDEKIEGYDWIKLKMYYDKIIEN